jgi:hypothetical protein
MALLPTSSLETVCNPKPAVVGFCLVLVMVVFLAAPVRAQQGPDVVIIAEEDTLIYEFRQNGQLRMIRVVPNVGKPYYLVPRDPTKGDGDLQRVDALVASWVLWEFD